MDARTHGRRKETQTNTKTTKRTIKTVNKRTNERTNELGNVSVCSAGRLHTHTRVDTYLKIARQMPGWITCNTCMVIVPLHRLMFLVLQLISLSKKKGLKQDLQELLVAVGIGIATGASTGVTVATAAAAAAAAAAIGVAVAAAIPSIIASVTGVGLKRYPCEDLTRDGHRKPVLPLAVEVEPLRAMPGLGGRCDTTQQLVAPIVVLIDEPKQLILYGLEKPQTLQRAFPLKMRTSLADVKKRKVLQHRCTRIVAGNNNNTNRNKTGGLLASAVAPGIAPLSFYSLSQHRSIL